MMVSLVLKIECLIINSKLDARSIGWTKKEVETFRRNSMIFLNTILAGLESAIVTKRHLLDTFKSFAARESCNNIIF